MNPPCIDAETYGSCASARGRVLNFNYDYMLDVNRYADVDANPYVVGSQAYNIAHGLPPGPSWIDRTDAAAAARDAAVAGTPVGSPGAGLLSGETASPSLLPLLAIGILALVLLKR